MRKYAAILVNFAVFSTFAAVVRVEIFRAPFHWGDNKCVVAIDLASTAALQNVARNHGYIDNSGHTLALSSGLWVHCVDAKELVILGIS